MNNVQLDKAEKWFSELEIRTMAHPSCLWVNRDDIDKLFGIGVIYDEVLKELKSALGYTRFFWSGKDGEWLYLETL
jgi:hypothetical protein